MFSYQKQVHVRKKHSRIHTDDETVSERSSVLLTDFPFAATVKLRSHGHGRVAPRLGPPSGGAFFENGLLHKSKVGNLKMNVFFAFGGGIESCTGVKGHDISLRPHIE